ncbi:MAG: C4-dicarboxylate ABC transporter substrate-binding protein [Gammaproteobacteria bacterium]|nr:C4-dicarboxylate ABC transporter substrate-binding protein [Gammaproteobacteria bacterium]
MTNFRYLKALVVGLLLGLVFTAANAETTLKLGTVGRLGMPIGDAIEQALIPTATEVSGGKMIIEPHYRGSLCGEQKCGEQANQGLLQLWTSSTANFGTALSIFDLPYIFKDIPSADKISKDWMSDLQCEEAAKTAGHRCFVVYSSGGFREMGNTVKPVHTPADLKGIKWRVTKSPIEYTLIKNWGAIPVPYDWTQLYQGLQTGVVEGQYVAIPWQHVAKLHEVAKYFTKIGGSWSGNQISMDVTQYEALSAEEKEWIHTASQAFGESVRQLDQKWVEDGVTAIKSEIKEWYEPTDEEMALWREGAIDAWKNAKGTFDPALAEKALAEQGLDDFIAKLKAAGAL